MQPTPFTIAAWAVLVITLLLALSSWLAFRFVQFDLVNNILPLWLAVGFVAALSIVACRGWSVGVTLSLVILAVSGVPPLLRDFPAQNAVPLTSTPARPLRIVQFNVLKNNPTPWAVAAWIEHEQPDVVTMSETLGANRAIRRSLSAFYPYQTSCLSRMRCSTVILSRERPLASGGLAHGDPENRQGLSAAWARFNHYGRPYTLVAVHMMRPWPWGDQTPGRKALTAFLHTVNENRVIVAGDFNLTPWTVAMREQDRLFGITRLASVPSWPAVIGNFRTLAVMPIDHVYAGGDWHVRSLTLGPYLGSDHLPIVATLDDAQ